MLHRVLRNGVEVVLKENHFAKMVAIQSWIGAGSLHERESEFGMAHCIEHMLFKGTEQHKVGEISGKVEAFGGDINAYTTFDHTVYYLTLSSLYAQQGVELLSDAIFRSNFDAEELVREKEVILEEIRRSQDSPGHLLGRKVFEEIYRGTPAARPIIGYAETVAEFSRNDLVEFYRRWYQPTNMRVVVVGDFDSRQMFDWIDQAFGQSIGESPDSKLSFAIPTQERLGVQLIRGDYEQPRIELAFKGPPLEHADTIDLDLAAFALGAGEAARFNRRLRDVDSVASSLGASLYSPDFGGVFEVSAIPLPNRYLDCVRGIGRELAKLMYHEPVSSEELRRAQANLRADQLYQEETVAGQARALGFSLMTSQKTAYDAVYTARVSHSSGETIHNALHRWIDLERAIIVGIVPESMSLDEKEVEKAFLQGVAEGKKGEVDRFKTLTVTSSQQNKQGDIFRKPIRDGIDFVYRRNPNCELFNLTAVTEGGLRAEDETSAGLHHCIANLLASATEKLDSDSLAEFIEGRGAVLAGFSGKDSLGLKLQCFSEHVLDMTKIWTEGLLRPVFPEVQWRNTLNDIRDDIRSEKDSPAGIAVRTFQEQLYRNHPYRFPTYGLWSAVEAWDENILQNKFASYRDQGSWIIGGVGNLEPEFVYDMLARNLDSWHPKAAKRALLASSEQLKSPLAQTTSLIKKREQTHIVQATLGLTWGDSRRAALDTLSTILGGSGGRLFLNLRDRDSLAYTVTPILNYGCQPGIFGAYIACAPSKVQQALDGLQREFLQVIEYPVSSLELDRAKNYLIGGHESEMQRGDAQAMTMALMDAYGIGYNDFLRYSDRIQKVTIEDVREVACQLLDPARILTVTVGPEESN